MPYKHHVISTNNERLTSGFRTPSRPDHNGMDFTDADRLELTQDVVHTRVRGRHSRSEHSSVSAGIMGWHIDIRHEFKSSAEGNGGTLNGVNLRSAEYLTRYCHMKSVSPFKPGQTVNRGDAIGVMGATGNSTGVHLHFGLKENSVSWNTGTWVNPEPYLTGEKSMRGVESAKTVNIAIKVGDKVKVVNAVTYDGKPFRVYFDTYDVIQVNGDRVVIGVGAIVTAAVKATDISKV